MNRRSIGTDYEQRACDYLEKNGFEIIERNFNCKLGEVDIIGYDRNEDGNYLTFVEVKYRKNADTGTAVEAVNFRKQRKISMVADYFRMIRNISPIQAVRFDIIAIDGMNISWYKNAFYYIGRC